MGEAEQRPQVALMTAALQGIGLVVLSDDNPAESEAPTFGRRVAEIIPLETANHKDVPAGAEAAPIEVEPESALALAAALSASRAEHPRTVLVKRLADLLLLPEDKITPPECALIDEILVRLVDHIDDELKRRLAARVARMPNPPTEVLMRLAGDELTISRPILETCASLSDADILEIIRTGSRDHRLAIIARKTISSSVSEALLERGETEVVEALLKNKQSGLSHTVMQKLTERSRYVPSLQPLLLDRPELHPSLAHAMFWWVPSPLRRKILKRFGVSRRVIQNAIMDPVNGKELDPLSGDAAEREALMFIHGTLATEKPEEGELLSLITKGDVTGFFNALADAAKIEQATLMRILRDEGGEALAVLAKAIGLSRNDFVSILKVLDQAMKAKDRSESEVVRVTIVFDSLSNDTADLILRFWDKPRPRLAMATSWEEEVI